jgi:ankyrin repeat protein
MPGNRKKERSKKEKPKRTTFDLIVEAVRKNKSILNTLKELKAENKEDFATSLGKCMKDKVNMFGWQTTVLSFSLSNGNYELLSFLLEQPINFPADLMVDLGAKKHGDVALNLPFIFVLINKTIGPIKLNDFLTKNSEHARIETAEGLTLAHIATVKNLGLEFFQVLKNHDVNLNKASTEGITPLIMAAQLGSDKSVAALVSLGVENTTALDGQNALNRASIFSNKAIIGTEEKARFLKCIDLLGRYASPLRPSKLERATHEKLLKILIENCVNGAREGDFKKIKGAVLIAEQQELDIRAVVNGVTDVGLTSALLEASVKGDLEIFKYLVEKKANIEQSVKMTGETALSLACESGHTQIVKFLLNENAKKVICLQNIDGDSLDDGSVPLQYEINVIEKAVLFGHHEVVSLLIESDVCPNTVDHRHRSLLALAANLGHTEVIDVLLKKNAKINLFFNENDEDALMSAILGMQKKALEKLLEFYEAKYNPRRDTYDLIAASLFFRLIDYYSQGLESKPVLDFLCDQRDLELDINATDEDGFSAIEYAVIVKAEKAISILLEQDHLVVSFRCISIAALEINNFDLVKSLYRKYKKYKKADAQAEKTDTERKYLISILLEQNKEDFAFLFLTKEEKTILDDSPEKNNFEKLLNHWNSLSVSKEQYASAVEEDDDAVITQTVRAMKSGVSSIKFLKKEQGWSHEQVLRFRREARKKPDAGSDAAEEKKEAENPQVYSWFEGFVSSEQARVKAIENSSLENRHFLLIADQLPGAEKYRSEYMSRFIFSEEHGIKHLKGYHWVTVKIIYQGKEADIVSKFTHEIKRKGTDDRFFCISIPSDEGGATLLMACCYLSGGLHNHSARLPERVTINLNNAPAPGLSPRGSFAGAIGFFGAASPAAAVPVPVAYDSDEAFAVNAQLS